MKKNKFKKGELLVETIVAMSIFVSMTMISFEAYKTFARIAKKENEYIFFESICYSIDELYDNLGRSLWAKEFFGEKYHYVETSGYGEQRYLTNFTLTDSNDPRAIYILSYHYDGEDLIVDIENVETGQYVIEELNYGPSLASSTVDSDYYEQIKEHNTGIVQQLPAEEEIDLEELEDDGEDEHTEEPTPEETGENGEE